jgi:hypothetical protein
MANFRRENSSRGKPVLILDQKVLETEEEDLAETEKEVSAQETEAVLAEVQKCLQLLATMRKRMPSSFQTKGNKPVLCSECFRGKSDSAPRTNSSGITQEQFEILNKNLI